MLLLILILIIGLTIFCEYRYKNDSWSNWDMSRIITIPMLVINLISLFIMAILLVDCRVIDSKIELYQKQNKDIEQKIEITVKQYMNFEKDTYGELKPDSYINLVNLYPELKSDELVKQQIELYTKNNEKITELKQEKINETLYKWWIYFGG